MVKRALDLVLAGVGIVVLPVLGAAAVAIKLHHRGPVLIHQERIGRHGAPFTIHKLRAVFPASRTGGTRSRPRAIDPRSQGEARA